MTRSSQKKGERYFVKRAAECMGRKWSIDQECECPDFIMSEGAHRFGLEVCEIFTGKQGKKGARMKERESISQKKVNALQREYELKENVLLSVKFVGDMCDENMAVVLQGLFDKDFTNKPPLRRCTIESDKGRARLRAHVRPTLPAKWFYVNDRVGWVDFNAEERIFKKIREKSRNLQKYKDRADLGDIRLLLVANRIMNSGKLTLQEKPALDLRGFQAVYFLSYPQTVTVFDDETFTVFNCGKTLCTSIAKIA